jgi:hypothetical protein
LNILLTLSPFSSLLTAALIAYLLLSESFFDGEFEAKIQYRY